MCSYLAMSKEASKCVGSLASTSSCTVCMAMLIKKVSDNSCEDVIYLYFVRVCVKNKTTLCSQIKKTLNSNQQETL